MKIKKWTAGLLAACLMICGPAAAVSAKGTDGFEAASGFAAAEGLESVEGWIDGSTEGPDVVVPGLSHFEVPEITYYNKIIFVGDSRTEHTSEYVSHKDIRFVAKGGMGLSWFQGDGIAILNNLLRREDFTTPLRTAVVFNLGFNDLYNQDLYIEYMNNLAPKLANQNCDLYYMSVNPADNTIATNPRPDSVVRAFNTALRTQLDERFTYINCFDYLKETGFETSDGMHYSSMTYDKIFQFVMQQLNAKKPVTDNVTWEKSGLYWYAVNPKNGARYKDRWVAYEGAKFHVDAKGRMEKNKFITTNGKKYYVGASGRMYTSQWLQIGEKRYYLQADGSMAVNTVIGGYPVDENGEWTGESPN